MPAKKVPYLARNIKKKKIKSTEFKSILMVLSLDYVFTTWLNTMTWNTFSVTSQSILASNGIPKQQRRV